MRRSFPAYTLLSIVVVVVLVVVDLAALALRNPSTVLRPHYYLALGDSLTFGYQPNLNFTDGFADQVFRVLQKADITDEVNFACAGETTTSMINGGCVGRYAHHGSYTGSQLEAALSFIRAHPGKVSPITLEIGANDLLPDWHSATCGPDPNTQTDLETMDKNLTQVILPSLTQALGGTPLRAGSLVLLNYYNPFAQVCPGSAPFIHTFNDHLAADAAQFGVPIVDIYTAFGGDTQMATNVCPGPVVNGAHTPYTWICNQEFNDIHPTTAGYGVMAGAVDTAVGYPV